MKREPKLWRYCPWCGHRIHYHSNKGCRVNQAIESKVPTKGEKVILDETLEGPEIVTVATGLEGSENHQLVLVNRKCECKAQSDLFDLISEPK